MQIASERNAAIVAAAGVVVVINSQHTVPCFHFGDKPSGIPTTVGGKGFIAETESTPSANQVAYWASTKADGAKDVEFAFKLASPFNAIAEATAANGEFKSSQARVGNASVDAKSSATADVKFETDGASGADVEVALEVVSAEVEFKSIGTVVDEASAVDEVKEEAIKC